MSINYDKLSSVLNKNGESLNSLKVKGVISDYAMRQINSNQPTSLKYIDNICQYFSLPIEEVVEIIPDEKD